MDPIVLVLVLCGAALMLVSFLIGAWVIMNRPAEKGTTLLSAEDLEALVAEEKVAANQGARYSNVYGARMGYDSQTLLSTRTDVSPQECESQCNKTAACQGFQIYGSNSCDLLANVSETYAFSDASTNLVTVANRVPLNILGVPLNGEIDTRKDLALTPSSSPVDTVAKCARACKQQEADCKSFSWSETAGCKLKKAKDQVEGSLAPVDQNNFSSYFLKGVNHDDWVSAPAPSPS